MVDLRLEDITKTFDSPPVTAVKRTNLTVEHGEFFTLVGPSGCGKTTMLRMIAGLETPTQGDIYFDDRRVTDLTPQQRDIAMVFQNIALYPHMSVRDNIGYGLKVRGETDNMDESIEEAAELLDITDQLDKSPNQLSGGQQQRVALGRAIVRDPNLLLLDEPMSDLDAKLKAELRVVVQELHQELDTTIVYVTHDQKEAMTMSTRVGLLWDGEFEQIDTPDRIFDHPSSEFAATFVGQPAMNVVDATFDSGSGLLTLGDDGDVTRALDISNVTSGPEADSLQDGHVRVGFRPQHVTLTDDWENSLMPLTLHIVEQDGNEFNLYTSNKNGEDITAVTYKPPSFEESTNIGIDEMRRIYIFDPDSGDKLLQLDSGEFTNSLKRKA